MTYVLERQELIPRPLAEVARFFEDAANLERITPPELRFKILTPTPIAMRAGTIIDYQIRLWGVPLTWRTRIEIFEPGARFVDLQERGPYKLWRHEHRFVAEGEKTRMFDRVEYELPFGPLGRVVHAAVVKRQLERIFDYRHKVTQELFH